MHTPVKQRTLLQKALDTLPSRHGVIRSAQQALEAQGVVVSVRHLYEVVKGRSKRPELVSAILDAVESAKNQAAELAARAEKLAQA